MSRIDSAARAVPFPGIRWGDYPERAESSGKYPSPPLCRGGKAGRADMARRLGQVRARCAELTALDALDFRGMRDGVRIALARDGLSAEAVERCCAYVVEAARRSLDLAAYDGQVIAALHMLDNRLVEMATGEGKSLSVALAAAMGALAGIPVHVLTANDYLVMRDAQAFRLFYELLGLQVASVVAGQAPEARRSAYAQDIVYVTAKEVAFDYLRDRLSHGGGASALQQRVESLDPAAPRRLLRGLCMAIVDEADAILIDEAQTPLILSREADDAAGRAFLWQAWALSGRLEGGREFVRLGPQQIALTDAGRERVRELSAHLQPVWKNTRHREDTIATALVARHLLELDVDYLVVERKQPARSGPAGAGSAFGEIAIVDPTTGRIAEGRKWSGGLHALVAIKEGLRPDVDLETLARITFQRFFRRYHRLGGMSGTLREARGELARVYGLPVSLVGPRLPGRRIEGPVRCFATDSARWGAVVSRVQALVAQGRPVLIGTESVGASAALVARLRAAGIEPALLNARFDTDEAGLVARAGRHGQVTVSTNMAGRGTDIAPDDIALRAGGLHVIGCQHNGSRRHDRQLAGRAGRQGQPGSSEAWLSLESARYVDDRVSAGIAWLLRRLVSGDRVRLSSPLLGFALRLQQCALDASSARTRARLLREDSALDQGLNFSTRS